MERGAVAQLEGVEFCYLPGKPVLRDVSLGIRAGEIVGLLGPNGAGKTTIAKMLCGLLRPNSGKVLLAWQDIASLTRRQVSSLASLVFQNPDDQIFKPTVLSEVMVGPILQGRTWSEARTRALASLGEMRLQACSEKSPYDLDLWQRKLLGIAAALAVDPKCLVFDEPTLGQDHAIRAFLAKWTLAWRGSGKAVVLISHDTTFLAEVCDTMYLIVEGCIVGQGHPADIFAPEMKLPAGVELPLPSRLSAHLGWPDPIASGSDFISAWFRRRGHDPQR